MVDEEEGETAQMAAFLAAFCSAVRGARRERREREAAGAGAEGFWATSEEEEELDWMRRPSLVSSADKVGT